MRSQYRRGERADAARHRRNGANDGFRFCKRDVAAERLRFLVTVYADIDDRLSGVKLRRADALAPSGRGNEDVRPARDLRGIFGF